MITTSGVVDEAKGENKRVSSSRVCPVSCCCLDGITLMALSNRIPINDNKNRKQLLQTGGSTVHNKCNSKLLITYMIMLFCCRIQSRTQKNTDMVLTNET